MDSYDAMLYQVNSSFGSINATLAYCRWNNICTANASNVIIRCNTKVRTLEGKLDKYIKQISITTFKVVHA